MWEFFAPAVIWIVIYDDNVLLKKKTRSDKVDFFKSFFVDFYCTFQGFLFPTNS